MDPNEFQTQQGTVSASLQIQSSQAVNVPLPVRELINSRQPDQRGTIVDIPGALVDLIADPNTNRNPYYVLRQDTNQVLVFNAKNNTQVAALRTGNTPKGMAFTFDQRYLWSAVTIPAISMSLTWTLCSPCRQFGCSTVTIFSRWLLLLMPSWRLRAVLLVATRASIASIS